MGLNRFQYVGKDYTAIVEDCVARIKERYGDKFNDFMEDSSAMMLIEAFAYQVDLLLFYLDRQANETYLPTAIERQNVINLCKLVGYVVSGARPAEVDLTITMNESADSSVRIPRGAIVGTEGGVWFETKEEAVIEAGGTSIVVGAVQGETFEEGIGVSSGEPNQFYYLPRASVITLTRLVVGEKEWSAVDSVAEAFPEDAVFMVDMDAWGRGRVSFGDGVNGRIPEEGARIVATYRVGGGAQGNVAAGTITRMRSVAKDGTGARVPVTVTNVAPASGGADPESIERARMWAPRSFAAQKRSVTGDDCITAAMEFEDETAGRIAKANAVVRERTAEANVIRYYVLAYAEDSTHVALASESLKSSLLAYLNTRKMLTDWIEVEDGAWVEMDIVGTVSCRRGVKEDVVRERIMEALEKLFDIEIRDMGQPLRISDLYAAIDNVEGVLHVELASPSSTVEAEAHELIVLGAINLSFEFQG